MSTSPSRRPNGVMVRPVCPLVSTMWTAPASTWPQYIVHDSPLSPASEYWYFDYCGLAGTFTWISNRPPSLFGLIMMKHIYLGFLARGRLPGESDCSKLWDRHSWSASCDLLLLLLPKGITPALLVHSLGIFCFSLSSTLQTFTMHHWHLTRPHPTTCSIR